MPQIGKYFVNVDGKRFFISSKNKKTEKETSIPVEFRYITLTPVAAPAKETTDATPWIPKAPNRLPESVKFTISRRKGRYCFTDGRDKKSLTRAQLKGELDRMLKIDSDRLIDEAISLDLSAAA